MKKENDGFNLTYKSLVYQAMHCNGLAESLYNDIGLRGSGRTIPIFKTQMGTLFYSLFFAHIANRIVFVSNGVEKDLPRVQSYNCSLNTKENC